MKLDGPMIRVESAGYLPLNWPTILKQSSQGPEILHHKSPQLHGRHWRSGMDDGIELAVAESINRNSTTEPTQPSESARWKLDVLKGEWM